MKWMELRLTAWEREELERRAKAAGKTKSRYLREGLSALLSSCEVSGMVAEGSQPGPSGRLEAPPVGRIGVNLAQIERGLERLGCLSGEDQEALRAAYRQASCCAAQWLDLGGTRRRPRERVKRVRRFRMRASGPTLEALRQASTSLQATRSELARRSLQLDTRATTTPSAQIVLAAAELLRSGRALNAVARQVNSAVLHRHGASPQLLAAVRQAVSGVQAALDFTLGILPAEAQR